MTAVSDSGPLIALHEIGHIDLLHAIVGTVLIPPAVAAETYSARPRVRPAWILVASPAGTAEAGLDAGEGEAITLGLEKGLPVLIDERHGREAAKNRGLIVTGTLGILLEAKRRGLVTEVKPLLARLREAGFRMSAALEREVLKRAGE